MKFCYADESLDGNGQLAQVMVGIVVDAQRLNRSRQDFSEIFDSISSSYPEALKELKGSRIFYGIGAWRKVPPEFRKGVFRQYCDWLDDRKHSLALSAIDIGKFSDKSASHFPPELGDSWIAGAMHLALQLQKLHQRIRKNKGHTILILDENKVKADKLNEVLYSPPSWTDSYYRRGKKQDSLDQIIDSAFFTKSHHAGMAQVADLFAFVFRRYAELVEYAVTPEYEGEQEDIADLKNRLTSRLINKSNRWVAKSGDCAQAYREVAPASLLSI